MAIYMYQCEKCGVRFERMQRMSEDPLTACPECDGRVHRVIQPVGIIFKGSGFYVTDNRQGVSPVLGTSRESEKSGEEKTDDSDKTQEETTTSTQEDD